jgi:hypothetical protein
MVSTSEILLIAKTHESQNVFKNFEIWKNTLAWHLGNLIRSIHNENCFLVLFLLHIDRFISS